MSTTAAEMPRRRSRLWTNVLIAAGAVLLLVAGVAIAYPTWWNHRSTVGGQRLVKNFTNPAGTLPAEPTKCVDSPQTVKGQQAAGLVKIPNLSLTAPVLQGLSDPVLAVAAGHDPDSPWPGDPGESLLESHDVSYFSKISDLRTGDQVLWIDHCDQLTFKVTGHEILSPGQEIEAPAGDRGLALVTCYPTDVLFFVSQRYVLLTTLVSKGKASSTPGKVTPVTPAVKVPAPSSLVAQGLGLSGSGVSVGVMKVTGSPSSAWVEGPASLDLESLALESYIGAEKSVEQRNSAWWDALAAPGVAMPGSLWSNGADTNVTEDISGNSVVSVTLSSSNETFVLDNLNGVLLIKSITVP